jgi:hypothetical protein
LGQALVQIYGRAIRVKSGTGRNHVIFSSADCSLRSVRAFDEWGHEFPFDVELLGHLPQWDTLLVIHPDSIDNGTISAKEFHGLPECHRGVLVAQAEERLDIDISSMATDLEVSCAGGACFWQGSRIIQVQGLGSMLVCIREGLRPVVWALRLDVAWVF